MPWLEASPPAMSLDARTAALTPDQMLARRTRDDSQGLFGFLRGDRKVWTVTYDEQAAGASFPLVHSQHVTTAAGLDTRDHRARDERLSEGPIPVHCRSASCGTCWVGVLGGAEKLSPMDNRECKVLAECGYATSDEPRPIIRLACMAQAYGAVSIVYSSLERAAEEPARRLTGPPPRAPGAATTRIRERCLALPAGRR